MSKRLFVVGAGRSGTKYLMNMLNNSKQIHLAPEMHFFSWLIHDGFMKNLKAAKKTQQPSQALLNTLRNKDNFGTYWRRDLDMQDAELKAVFASDAPELKDVYEFLIDRDAIKSGKQPQQLAFVGEKTPSNIFHLDKLINWFADCQVLYIYRNPLDVLRSEVNKDAKPDYPISKKNPVYPYGLVIFVFFIRALGALNALRYIARFPGQVALIRYEDLAHSPDTILRKYFSSSELEFDDTICKVKQVDSSYKNLPQGTVWSPPTWVIWFYNFFLGKIQARLDAKKLS